MNPSKMENIPIIINSKLKIKIKIPVKIQLFKSNPHLSLKDFIQKTNYQEK